MPHVAERFTGHLPTGDPRSVFTGCGGADWPTIPPHRWLVVSPNATQVWYPLQYEGILFSRTSPMSAPYLTAWLGQDLVFPFSWATLQSTYVRADDIINWVLEIKNAMCYWPTRWEWAQTPGPRNVNIDLWSQQCLEQNGITGSDMKMLQVEFDATRPPGGWPPLP